MKRFIIVLIAIALLVPSSIYAQNSPTTESISFSGSGDDLILADINPKDFPFIYFKCRVANFFTVKISNEAGEEDMIIGEIGAYEGVHFIGDTRIDHISMIEISGAKDWEIIFIPKINQLIKKYSAPITISGSGSAVFEVDGLGIMADIEFTGDGFSVIKQFNEEGRQNMISGEIGDYNGKVKIKNDHPIIVVETSDIWNINFYSQDNKKPEDSVAYEFTPVTIVSTDNEEKEQPQDSTIEEKKDELEITPANIGTKVKCGDSFEFMFYYQPIMTKSQSYQTAVGKFLMFRVHITNLTPSSVDGLLEGSFNLHGDFNGVKQTFKLDMGSTFSTSYRWELNQITDKLEPGIPLDTYLVFDVIGKADSWYLEFNPKSGSKTFCTVNINVPKINYMD